MNIKILDSVDSSEIRELRAEILSQRNVGNVLFEIKQISSDISIEKTEDLIKIIDLFVSQFGYAELGDRWQEITQAAAAKILLFLLTKDLAYSAKIMPVEAAEQISIKIFNFFNKDCQFFTNAVFVNNYSALSAWNSLTKATFDTGVIFINETLIGIIWVKDED